VKTGVYKVPDSGPTIGQREDGSWYWVDETWNDGDNIHHPTYQSALAAQNWYVQNGLGEGE
jgi:hypothetical protein